MRDDMNKEEMTTLDALQELRTIAASIVVDNGGYRERLLTVADWIEDSFAGLLTAKSITFQQAAWPESEAVKQQKEVIQSLQQNLALLQASLARSYEREQRLSEELRLEIENLKEQLGQYKAGSSDEEEGEP